MLKKGLILAILIGFSLMFIPLIQNFHGNDKLSDLAKYYTENAEHGAGAANIVTAIVITYRGLDTLGEVVILFLTASVIGFFLKISKSEKDETLRFSKLRKTSELLETATKALVPTIFMFGVYIFINGHLTPGGGFQGGAVIATGFVLMLLANPQFKVNHKVIEYIESLSGFSFAILGALGAIIGLGFLDNKILPLGTFGELLSAGIIPVIYSFIGLKVGAELSGIVETLSENQSEIEI